MYQEKKKQPKNLHKRNFDSSHVCLFNSDQQSHTDVRLREEKETQTEKGSVWLSLSQSERLRKVPSFLCSSAGTLGRLPCFSQPQQGPIADLLVALDRAEMWPARHAGCLQGVPPLPSVFTNRVFLAYYSLPAANINNRSSIEKPRC